MKPRSSIGSVSPFESEDTMTRAGPYGQSFASKHLKEDRYQEALEAATEAISLDEDDPDNYLEQAQAYLALERYEDAINSIIACVEKNQTAQSVDEDLVDDTLFTALVDWGKTFSAKEPEKAIALLGRYAQILPKGGKHDEVTEWTKWFRGESKMLVKERL
jgi:tetratricopeptide (TPR) repeat protein